jgi:modulator of drug activity B
MENTKKVLLINTHLNYPNWSEGKLNDSFFQIAKDFFSSKSFQILETKVEDGYNPEEEVEKHLAADIVILQTPINWFGAPWIYKKYVDEVFNSGLHSQKLLSGDGRSRENSSGQYGSGGKMLGKKFMLSATWNAPAEAFNNKEQQLMQGKSSSDLLLNITSNYRFCGCDIMPEYNCFDIFKNGDVAKDLRNYPAHLARYLNL